MISETKKYFLKEVKSQVQTKKDTLKCISDIYESKTLRTLRGKQVIFMTLLELTVAS